ncbi:hypothetical protein PoB_001899900 [Plakobranchus ocellatus]|uniref:Mutator-like transposase domain-containing protein n=1 Tax=Plakobranchus ocellatus TaxID=259542 RepID=A0AAV3ZDN7_9GAST|nr:hypothetical protein PoB_001899900 [Plakobranchus ocellatus]
MVISDTRKGFVCQLKTMYDKAVSKVKAAYGKGEDDIVDIAFSYDGTWQKRGHTSKHGLGVLIDVTRGLAMDYHVMSSFCQPYSTPGVKKKEEEEAA